jgi:hypothetical protein
VLGGGSAARGTDDHIATLVYYCGIIIAVFEEVISTESVIAYCRVVQLSSSSDQK